MITLNIEPTATLTWAQFKKMSGFFAIALDGIVKDGPRFEIEGPWQNFNHHEGVSRLETRATCAQVLLAIRQGLFDTFVQDGEPTAHVFVNDCDEDVALSYFLLKNHFLVTSTMNPAVNQLVTMEDFLDTTGGAYAFPKDLPSLQKLMWIFEPFHNFRISGRLDKRDSDEFASVIGDVERRIMAFITGNSGTVHLNTAYNVLEKFPIWSLVEEKGQHARLGLFGDGVKAFVAVRQRPDNRFVYTVGRTSQYIPFDVPAILTALNKVEGKETPDNWGGGNTIGGSPRVSGSRLNPLEVKTIINEVLARGKKR